MKIRDLISEMTLKSDNDQLDGEEIANFSKILGAIIKKLINTDRILLDLDYLDSTKDFLDHLITVNESNLNEE